MLAEVSYLIYHAPAHMTITADVQRQFFGDDSLFISPREAPKQVIRLPPTAVAVSSRLLHQKGSPWTDEEHERFLAGLELYPRGPWKLIARVVATRTTRQTMTHAQKYRQRIARHKRQQAVADQAPWTPSQLEKPHHLLSAGGDSRSDAMRQQMLEIKSELERFQPTEHGALLSEDSEWLLDVDAIEFDNEVT